MDSEACTLSVLSHRRAGHCIFVNFTSFPPSCSTLDVSQGPDDVFVRVPVVQKGERGGVHWSQCMLTRRL